jgi:hypothetical protein
MSTLTLPLFYTQLKESYRVHLEPYTSSVRETPDWIVRQRWAYIRHRREELRLVSDIEVIQSSKPVKPQLAYLNELADRIGVFICQNFHANIRYVLGDKHYSCVACKRKYGLVTVDPDTITEPGVYVTSNELVHSGPTRQALCRNGFQGLS